MPLARESKRIYKIQKRRERTAPIGHGRNLRQTLDLELSGVSIDGHSGQHVRGDPREIRHVDGAGPASSDVLLDSRALLSRKRSVDIGDQLFVRQVLVILVGQQLSNQIVGRAGRTVCRPGMVRAISSVSY